MKTKLRILSLVGFLYFIFIVPAFSQYQLQSADNKNRSLIDIDNIEQLLKDHPTITDIEYSDKPLQRKKKINYNKECKEGDEECLSWFTGEPHGTVGMDYFLWTTAMRFDVGDLVPHDGESISKVKLYGGDMPANAILKIWQGTDENDLTLEFSQDIINDIVEADWFEVDLNTPYIIDGSKELWVGVTRGDKGANCYPATRDRTDDDTSTNNDGKGNMIKLEEWRKLTDYGYQGHWLQEIKINGDWVYWHELEYTGKDGEEEEEEIKIGRIGLGNVNWTSSIRFDTDDLAPYHGWTIESFRVFMSERPWYKIGESITVYTSIPFTIWQGPDANNLTEKRTQNITVGADWQWGEAELSDPYTIDANKELWISVQWIDNGEGSNPGVFDNGVDAPGKGNMIRKWLEDWTELTTLGYEGDWLKEICIKQGEKINPLFDQLGPYCEGQTPDLLPNTSKNGVAGTWEPETIDTDITGTTTYTFTPNSEEHAYKRDIKIEVLENAVPSFNQFGPYCIGETPDELPEICNDGISGQWHPHEINTNTPADTYSFVFTPDQSETCAVEKSVDIVISDALEPEFNDFGPYCIGDNPDELPEQSLEGIQGSWTPNNINTDNAGTYTFKFTPDPEENCAEETTIEIKVHEIITPEFDKFGPYDEGATPNQLPNTSNNGVDGSWYPDEIDTSTSGVFTYTFTPDSGENCAEIIEMDIEIIENSFDIFFEVFDINYKQIDDARIKLNGKEHQPSYYIFSGYMPGLYEYVVSKEGYAEARDFVAVIDEDVYETVILLRDYASTDNHIKDKLNIFPNPTSDILNIESPKIINTIKILDIKGRNIINKNINDNKTVINIGTLEEGLYIIQVKMDESIESHKIKIHR